MARIAGVDLPRNKRVEIGLTYIYGIGRTLSRRILDKLNIDYDVKTDQLSDAEINSIRKIIDTEYRVEGELRAARSMNIKRLMDLGSYKGLRHRKSLPVRGQRTRSNGRTKRGKRVTIGAIKKEVAVKMGLAE